MALIDELKKKIPAVAAKRVDALSEIERQRFIVGECDRELADLDTAISALTPESGLLDSQQDTAQSNGGESREDAVDDWRSGEARMLVDPVDVPEPILAERERQINAEGWSPEHDDEHGASILLLAAQAYRLHDQKMPGSAVALFNGEDAWPWDLSWWKPKSRRRNLERAGALALAARDCARREQSNAYVGHINYRLNQIIDAYNALPAEAPSAPLRTTEAASGGLLADQPPASDEAVCNQADQDATEPERTIIEDEIPTITREEIPVGAAVETFVDAGVETVKIDGLTHIVTDDPQALADTPPEAAYAPVHEGRDDLAEFLGKQAAHASIERERDQQAARGIIDKLGDILGGKKAKADEELV